MIKKREPLSFRISIFSAVIFLCLFTPLHGQDSGREPININIIIDGSSAFYTVKDEITAWIFNRLDQILVFGDRVTVWNTENAARIIYSNTVNSNTDKEDVRKSIRDISASGDNPDFSGALRDAVGRQGAGFNYTLLISTSNEALGPVLSGPHANLLRFSRVEEFPSWRALVVGLDIDARVRRAAAAFLGS